MYIPRNIDRYLMEWKNQKDHKPLLLRGARQVGKSFSIRHLGETFESYIEVNFEKHPELKEIFVAVSDVHEIANRLALIAGKSIEPGKTLLFLDEIKLVRPRLKVCGHSRRISQNFTSSRQGRFLSSHSKICPLRSGKGSFAVYVSVVIQ